MIVFLILLVFLILYRINFCGFHENYLDYAQCTCIRGIFAIIIFLAHASNYLELGNGIADRIFTFFLYMVGQSMVSMYFFYSGYGIMESYKYKEDYDRYFFRNRILKTLLHFDLAVILYILLNLAYGKTYSMKIYLFSLIGYASVGNSNWFVFVIMLMYLLTLAAFILMKSFHISKQNFGILMTVLSILLWTAMRSLHMYETYYNTLMCYPAGILYSCYKDKIDIHLKSIKSYIFCVLGILAGIAICVLFRGNSFTYSTFTVLVSLLVVMITSLIRIENPVLLWIGTHSFSIYILQRIPMILLKHYRITSPVIFTASALIGAAVLAYCFHIFLSFADRYLFSKS